METIQQLFSLEGQVAVVTGGQGRLGSQMCDALAEAGAHVAVATIDFEPARLKARQLSERHAEAIAIRADLTQPDSVSAMIEEVLRAFGRLDVLINNAYAGCAAPFESMSREQFESAITGGLTTTFLCSQAAVRCMKARRAGAIINIGSIYGVVSPDHRIYGDSGINSPCNYGVAKAGLLQFTRWLATYLAADGIRVNAITPGGFYNPEFQSRPDYEDCFVRNYKARTPLARMGGSTDLKGAVVFLASEASRYVTGHNLVVDGGWTAW